MLKISFCNWLKENNHGLCDFKEISTTAKKEFGISETGIIYRNVTNYDLIFYPRKNVPERGNIPEHQPIIFVTETDGQFKFTDLKNLSNSEEPLSLLAPIEQKKQPSSPKQGSIVQIFQGSVIKMGKSKVQIIKIESEALKGKNLYKKQQKSMIGSIKRISISNYQLAQENHKNDLMDDYKCSSSIMKQYEEGMVPNFSVYDQNPVCKICFSKTIECDNSLISLCKCNGSSKFIHEKCLKKWVYQKSQLIKQENKSVYVASMKGFECEVCKELYSLDQIFNLMFQRSQNRLQQYIALTVHQDSNKLLFVIDLQQNPAISLGRDNDNTVVINDITVSRHHGQIRLNKKSQCLQLIDLNSKFGTNLKKASIVLNYQPWPHRLQKGRTYMEIHKIKDANCKSLMQKFMMCYDEMN